MIGEECDYLTKAHRTFYLFTTNIANHGELMIRNLYYAFIHIYTSLIIPEHATDMHEASRAPEHLGNDYSAMEPHTAETREVNTC